MNFGKKLLLWLGTLFLVLLCLIAARWQLNKGLALTNKNQAISAQENAQPVLNPNQIDAAKYQWKKLNLDGEFLNSYRLVRDQYFNGQYGFHILQDFKSNSLGKISVDRGWVKAGKNAETPPLVPGIYPGPDRILVRVRSEFLSTHLSGSFFAIPSTKKVTREVYFDQLDGQNNKPISPIDLPDLTTGPHYAYAFQWFIFAIVILVGRIIIGRKLYSKADRT